MQVIASMPQLRTLRVQPRSSVFHRHLTDTSVRNWGSSPPHTIALYNCSTSITLQGIFDMIKVSLLSLRVFNGHESLLQEVALYIDSNGAINAMFRKSSSKKE